DAESAQINRKSMLDSFRQGYNDLIDIWRLILPPAALIELRRLQRQPDAEFRFADELWARAGYDFALGYPFRAMGRDRLLQAITPLYLGWVASFAGEAENAAGSQVEDRLELLARHFETQKRYFISRWRWPDNFNP